jgi:DNA repair exonuclease SbcCD ATPase subunit
MARLEATKAEIAELDKMPVLSKENDDEALHAAQVEFIQASKSLEALTDQRSRTQTTRNLLQEQKTYAEKLVQQHGINKEAREVLSELRDVFSQNRAQARYLRERIAELNVRLQEFVSNTGMPFSLRLDEEQRLFMYKTADGYEHPAAHLSGAQKAMSAVALQMALFQVMQPNMMLYLLDEPTEALDEENKAIMGRMFHRMSMMMPKIGGTMLIVTRDDQIVAGCAATVEAGARR